MRRLTRWTSRGWIRPGAAALLTGALLVTAPGDVTQRFGLPQAGVGRLVAYEPMAEPCMIPAAEQRAGRREAALGTPAGQLRRSIKDPFPSFAAVAVDPVRNEVVFTDESLFQVLVYDRLENAPAGVSRPKRAIGGDRTGLEFQSGDADEKTGEIITANNDTRDKTLRLRQRERDVAPVRRWRRHGMPGCFAAGRRGPRRLGDDSAVVTYRSTRRRIADPDVVAMREAG